MQAVHSIELPEIDLQDIKAIKKKLSFILNVIKASEDLLETTIFQLYGNGGSFENELLAYLRVHTEEERGHYAWLQDDLAEDEDPLNCYAVAMAGMQYYLIKHVHPAAILGYMAFLEGNPTSMDSVELLESMYGEKLFRTVRYHAEHDLDHREELFKMIDKTPDKLKNIVMDSALNTARLMAIAQNEWINHG